MQIVLLAGIYLFYSLSPLIYCLASSDLQAPPASGNTVFLSTDAAVLQQDGVSIRSDQENKKVSSMPLSQVLLKKKRAISMNFKEIIGLLSVQFSGSAQAPDAPCTALLVPDEGFTAPNGFRFYHSGISPPSA